MKKIKTLFLTAVVIGCNLVTYKTYALDDPGFPGNGDPGTPAAPINDWITPMLIIGVMLMYIIYRKHPRRIVK